MEISSYRLVKRQHAASAFDGEGARLYGGRWNRQGSSVVYTSDSLALCCLEIFVHLPSYDLLRDYVYFQASFDSDDVLVASLEDGWDDRPLSQVSQAIGEQWLAAGTSPILRVPSVIVPEGSNYLFNIAHPQFQEIKRSPATPLHFDTRLQK